MYIPWIVMFLGFTNTKISNNDKLLSSSSLHSSTTLSMSPCTLSHGDQTELQSLSPLYSGGDPDIINGNFFCFLHLLLQILPVIIKTFSFKLRNM